MKDTAPKSRSEQEIAGYRDALNLIHESGEHMPFTANVILQLHGILCRYLEKGVRLNILTFFYNFSFFKNVKMLSLTLFLNLPVTCIEDDGKQFDLGVVRQYLIGSPYAKSTYSANGCAISSNVEDTIAHSRRELLERHICCEIWYKQSCILIACPEYNFTGHNFEIKLYTTTNVLPHDHFAIAALECETEDFFALGASVKTTFEAARNHAICEAVMLFHDVLKKIPGSIANPSASKLLSLRNKSTSQARKAYFTRILTKKTLSSGDYIEPICKTIIFEPLPNIYASRTFSADALNPRDFDMGNVPVMPLF